MIFFVITKSQDWTTTNPGIQTWKEWQRSSDLSVTETKTDTEMIDFSKTHTETNTEKIFNTNTIYTVSQKKHPRHFWL